MQIILSKSAFFLVKKDFNECGYDYDLIIIKSRLRKLECPHCHRQLACSGYYLRTIITAKGKKIIRIPRLQCGNRECVYKITRHLKTPPIIKPIPYFIRKFCQYLLINILVLALVKAPNPYLSKVLLKYLELGETGYSKSLSMYALKVIRRLRYKNLKFKAEFLLYFLMSVDCLGIDEIYVKNDNLYIKNFIPTFNQIPLKIKYLLHSAKFALTKPTDFVKAINTQALL